MHIICSSHSVGFVFAEMFIHTQEQTYVAFPFFFIHRQKKAVEGGAVPQADEAASLASTETSASADKRHQVCYLSWKLMHAGDGCEACSL